MKVLLILEYGVPHYRKFIIDWLKGHSSKLQIISTTERFNSYRNKDNKILQVNRLGREISLSFFNFFEVNKYDVVISTLNFRKLHTWFGWLFYRGKNWIFWGQGPGSTSNKIVSKLKRRLISNSLGYIVYTPNGKKELIELGVNPNKISIAYNTLLIKNACLTHGEDYILYVGRIQKRKGLEKVLYAIKDSGIKFVIVGEGGEYESFLRGVVSELGLNNQVNFLGAIYDDQHLKDIFSKAVAYVSPDHVGLGVVHSFAYGVPVITCKNRYHAPEFEYCSVENSYLYENDEELKQCIENSFTAKKNLTKRISAYNFYNENLDYKNVIKAFEFHISKVSE